MIIEIIIGVVALGFAFVSGVLVGKANKKFVTAAIKDVHVAVLDVSQKIDSVKTAVGAKSVPSTTTTSSFKPISK
jgi:hypothetical protein